MVQRQSKFSIFDAHFIIYIDHILLILPMKKVRV